MSGGATALQPRDTFTPQPKDERNTSYQQTRKQEHKAANSFSANVSSRAPRISTASPSFSAQPSFLSVVEHSNRSSSTFINHNSHSSSNRSSTNTNSDNYPIPSRRSGRGTPSSEISHFSKRSGHISKIHDEAAIGSTPKSKKGKASSVVDSGKTKKEPNKDTSKKKGFNIFSLFRRSKKKDSSLADVSILEEAMNDLALKSKSPAEIRAEELRLLHEEEFSKLRRQREKDKNRSIYDMLPQSRQIKSENTSRNFSSPNSLLSGSPSTAFISPIQTPRIRSSSSNSVGLPRPSTTFYPSQFNSPYSNTPASRSSTHFSPMSGYQEVGFGYASPSGAHRSTDSVNIQHARNLARSPLIPQQQFGGRQSFYSNGHESHSQLLLHPSHFNNHQFPQSHSPQYYRNSRAWG